MLWLGFPLYLLVGVITMIAYRWDECDFVDGKELLLDIVAWPFIVYYWVRSRRSKGE